MLLLSPPPPVPPPASGVRLLVSSHNSNSVSDGGYNDNTGAYTITVTQLVPIPSP